MSPSPRRFSAIWIVVLTVAILVPPGTDAGTETPGPSKDDDRASSGKSSAWDLNRVANLDRIGPLDERQRALLSGSGFFLAPAPVAEPSDADDSHARIRKATHLFHVYERNDYIQFPSFVTVDLAIDATHAYFDGVLREIEENHLRSRLEKALAALMAEAEKVRGSADTEEGRAHAARATTYWGVALQLLISPAEGDLPDVVAPDLPYGYFEDEEAPSEPEPVRRPVPLDRIPEAVRDDVEKVVRAVQAASGPLPVPVVRSKVDLTQMKPRGHYNRNGALQRYFRAMSWLGMARFEIGGDADDVPGIALLARSWLASEPGRTAMGEVLEVTSFFAGHTDAADLDAAAQCLSRAVPGAGALGADALVEPKALARFRVSLGELPKPRVQSDIPQVRIMGRRAFEDTVAMKSLLEPLIEMVLQGRGESVIPPLMGALGAAAVLGSDLARDELTLLAEGKRRQFLTTSIEKGRSILAGIPDGRWSDDAYHGTLHALRPLLATAPAGAPDMLRTDAWRRRSLQAFAAGWAELRHDTVLYGEQLGAECDAPTPDPPPGWVEPLPEVYGRLADMARELDRRLQDAGISVDGLADDNPYARPLSEKTDLLVGLLDFLRTTAEAELHGKALTFEQRETITLIGGQVEWLMISLADTDLLAPRDQDMAVIADVFTWRQTRKVVEVGVGHPDLIYAIIPADHGPVVARGAVMSYRELLGSQDERLTDEEWREMLVSGKDPGPPAWLAPTYASPVPAIELMGEGVFRCGPMSGWKLEL